MPITTTLLDTLPILHLRYDGHITLADTQLYGEIFHDYVMAQPIYILSDYTDLLTLPKNILNIAVSSSKVMGALKHNNCRAFAVLNARPLLRMSIQTLLRRERHVFTDDYEDAMAYLCSCIEADATSPVR